MCEREFFKKKDEKALTAKLNELQERCKERLLSVEDCISRLNKVDSFLNITNKAMTGTKVIVHSDMQQLPKCYKYQANSTKAVFVYDGRHWCFVSAYRNRMIQKGIGYHCEIEMSDTAREAVLKRYTFY